MFLEQDPETGWWVRSGRYMLGNTHDPTDCMARACAIHNHPSDHPLKDAPLFWRADRGILERICEHGVGHPDRDSAEYLTSIGKDYENIHGCCGCCILSTDAV